jgi:putative transcriptional regulator
MVGRIRFLASLVVALFLVITGITAAEAASPAAGESLAGRLLVAAPSMPDPRFARTVIYIVEHNANGAMGLVINKVIGRGPLEEFLKGFDIQADEDMGSVNLHYGGPVERSRGLILHTGDYRNDTTTVVNKSFSMTMDLDVLKAMGRGAGPRRTIVALGYSGWGPGQLEGEMKRDDWDVAVPDEDLVFDDEVETMWKRARERVRIKL